MEHTPRYDCPVILTRRENRPTRPLLMGLSFMLIYGLLLGPLVKHYLPKGYVLITLAATMAALMLACAKKGRQYHVYPDRLVEKRPFRKDRVFHYYAVTEIKRCALGSCRIGFGHRHLRLPKSFHNAGVVLSAMERYLLHKQNVVPISLIRILKELRMCA